MTLHSLFLRTELLFWQRLSEVHDLGDVTAILTAGNPTWFWGNLLIIESAPNATDVPALMQKCDRIIKRYSGLKQYLLSWQTGELSPEAASAFAKFGFTYSTAEVLTLEKLIPPTNPNSEMKLIEVDAKSPLWDKIEELNVEAFAPANDGGWYAIFSHLRFNDYRKLLAEGVGTWYAAMIGERVAGTFGIFPGDGFYRYQEVIVGNEFRRQGIARTMLYEAALRAKTARPEYEQVIVVDTDSVARGLYASLGFTIHSRTCAVKGKREAKVIPIDAATFTSIRKLKL